MARLYSVDLRERVVRAVAAGASRRATAAKFEVSVSFVIKLMQRWLRRGTVQPDRIGGWKRSTLAAHAERVRALVAAAPDLTLAELQSRLEAEGIAVSRSSVGRFLVAAELTRKKRRSMPPSRTARTSPPRGALGARAWRRRFAPDGAHQVKGVRAAIEAAGARPPASSERIGIYETPH
jgi:transposase